MKTIEIESYDENRVVFNNKTDLDDFCKLIKQDDDVLLKIGYGDKIYEQVFSCKILNYQVQNESLRLCLVKDRAIACKQVNKGERKCLTKMKKEQLTVEVKK